MSRTGSVRHPSPSIPHRAEARTARQGAARGLLKNGILINGEKWKNIQNKGKERPSWKSDPRESKEQSSVSDHASMACRTHLVQRCH